MRAPSQAPKTALKLFVPFDPAQGRPVPSLLQAHPLDRHSVVVFPLTMVEWGNGADRASNDADVSIAPSKIPYSGFSPVRFQGQRVRQDLQERVSVGLLPAFPRRSSV